MDHLSLWCPYLIRSSKTEYARPIEIQTSVVNWLPCLSHFKIIIPLKISLAVSKKVKNLLVAFDDLSMLHDYENLSLLCNHRHFKSQVMSSHLKISHTSNYFLFQKFVFYSALKVFPQKELSLLGSLMCEDLPLLMASLPMIGSWTV